MKDHVEALLAGNMGGRRSNIRVNSLLFEEDSLQIKREMVRQKQAKYRENMQQRVSLKLGGAGANSSGSRRATVGNKLLNSQTVEIVNSGPVSARNTINHQTSEERKKQIMMSGEVFGSAS